MTGWVPPKKLTELVNQQGYRNEIIIGFAENK